MSIYLDASVLVALVITEENTPKALEFVQTVGQRLVVSDYAVGEVSSAVAQSFRTGKIEIEEARRRLAAFDEWVATVADPVATEPADIRLANQYVRAFASKLRMPDAVHLAAARIRGLRIATFDNQMAVAAEMLRIDIHEF